MAEPKCPHCAGTQFELQDENISGAAFTLTIIRCSACGAPAGVLENRNIGQFLAVQGEKIDALNAAVADLQKQIAALTASAAKPPKAPRAEKKAAAPKASAAKA